MRRLFLALGAVSLLACGDSTAPEDSPGGTWALVSVNGDPLPYTVEENSSSRLERLSGQIFIHADGTFDETKISRQTMGGAVTTTELDYDGTWDHYEEFVYFFYSGGATITGTYGGDRITLTESGVHALVLVFERD